MEKPEARMVRLRRLHNQYRDALDHYTYLAAETLAAQKVMEEAKTRFSSCREDIIGDLFNGCFGQEWLLDPE